MKRALPVVVLLLALAGCSEPTATAADCNNQVRYDGTIYTEYAFTNHEATPLGSADRAVCDDTGVPGDPPKGLYFPDDPEQVDVLSVDGYPPDQVLAVDAPQAPLGVYFAESLSSAEIERISEELGAP